MKLTLLIVQIFFFGFILSQDNFVWDSVVRIDSTFSQKELFSRAKLFVATKYISGKDVTQLVDETTYTIVVKAVRASPNIKLYGGMRDDVTGFIHYTLTIAVKDGRYKYTLNNCFHEGAVWVKSGGSLSNLKPESEHQLMSTKFWNEVLKPDFKAHAFEILESLFNTMTSNKKSDW